MLYTSWSSKKKKHQTVAFKSRLSIYLFIYLSIYLALQSFLSKECAYQCRRLGFDTWVGKIPWRRNGNHSSIFVWKILWTEEPDELQSVDPTELDTT